MKAEEEQLAGRAGRILVRPSGTEALMRVMVEAKTEDVARQTAQRLAQDDSQSRKGIKLEKSGTLR